MSLLAMVGVLAACGEGNDGARDAASNGSDGEGTSELVIGAIPDQDPELLLRNYDKLADYLESELGIAVRYEAVTDYTAAVAAFKAGDLDVVWFGGLTGVQAAIETEGAEAIAQRDIDEKFTSVFIASADSGIAPIANLEGLSELKGKSFTFGDASSTSGRLMPQYFLDQAGVSLEDFEGEPGFSGSHDTTISLVSAGTYQAGVLNSQVWESRVADGTVDAAKVTAVFTSPEFADYHWVVRPDVDDETVQNFLDALFALSGDEPEQAEILDFFKAGSFVPATNDDYVQIEQVAREAGLITS